MDAPTSSTAKGERTRRLLLDTARVRFASDGYRDTSVAVISRAAGVGRTTAFVHFAGKEDLFLAAVDDDLTAMFDDVAARLWGPDFDGKVIDRILPTALEVVEAHPLARRLLAGLEPEFTARVLESPSFDVLRTALATLNEQAQHDGSVRPDLSPTALADGVVAVLVAASMASVQIGPAFTERFGGGLATALRGLLTADPRVTPSRGRA